MPFVPVENTAEVEVRMSCDGQKIENTLWFLHDGAIDATSLNALGSGILSWWVSGFAGHISNLVTLREIYSVDMTTATGLTNTQSGGGATGTLTGAASPLNSTLAISFRTGLRGRSFRGRNYLPAIDRDQMATQNTFNESDANGLISIYNDLVGPDALVTGWTWVVASRFSGVDVDGNPIPRVAGVATPITAVVIADLVVDSQRRRLPGRGE